MPCARNKLTVCRSNRWRASNKKKDKLARSPDRSDLNSKTLRSISWDTLHLSIPGERKNKSENFAELIRELKMSSPLNSLIKSLPISNEHLDVDALFDLIIEWMGEVQYPFDDIKSIVCWLTNGDDALWNDVSAYDINSVENRSINGPTLKPGTKITISQPSANSKKFNDMESVQAYLSNHQWNDDSEEVDVTTFDYTPTWNHYHIIESTAKKPKLARVLTEKQPTANVTVRKLKHTEKMPIKETVNGLIERTHQCPDCLRSYKQKSSLHRHVKSHLGKKAGCETVKNTQSKKSTPKKCSMPKRSNQSAHSPSVPLNNVETISTWDKSFHYSFL